MQILLLSGFFSILLMSIGTLQAAGTINQDPSDTTKIFADTAKSVAKLPAPKPLNTNTYNAANKYGFKDLFVDDAYSPAMPYTAKLHPMAVSFVEDYVKKQGKELEAMKGWGKPYFNMIDAIFMKYGIPRELKYLAVIESHLNAGTVSWVGAVGPWQFMPETGRQYGLMVSRGVDERVNYYKSTHAAARYLMDLYNIFGDWLLVIAAYNGGPGRVFSAIKKSGSRNFWSLQNYLPLESRNHVKKFIGTHYIFEGGGGVTTTTRDDMGKNGLALTDRQIVAPNLTQQDMDNTRVEKVSGKFNSLVIAKNISMDITEFNRLNPGFDAAMGSQTGAYEMRLPNDKMDLYMARKYQILNESVQLLLNSLTALPAAPVKEKVKTKKKGF
jgi:membrane-bound lytic murein transglycosylase D